MLKACLARGGMVSAPHHLAAQSGAAVLREGGNAIEAMVAAAATIAVVYPHMNGIGGDGFWLIAHPGRTPIAIRACGPAARLADASFYSGASSLPTRGAGAALTVAGALAGWQRALAIAAQHGARLPLTRLLQDAVAHAREGVPVTRSQAALTREKWHELAHVPGFAETFASKGLPEAGSTQTQPRLAATLEQLASAGLDDSYRGDVARSLARDLEAAGSPLRLADLEGFHASEVTPLGVELGCGRVFNHPPPTQGVSTLAILGLFERLGVREAESFAHVHGIVEATKRAFRWRNAHVCDPAHMQRDAQAFLAADSLAQEAAQISLQRAAPWPDLAAPGDTIWMGAADREGCVVSYIQSVYWEFGSGLVLRESGVQWQNRGASFTLTPGPNQLAPGRLPFHTLNPSLAQLKDGRVIAFGTMGGEGQPQTQAAVFTRHIHFKQDLQAAVTAPRWLLGRTWGEESTTLKLESRFDPTLINALQAASHAVQIVEDFDDRMGHAGAVSLHADGLIEGACDPRADGACAAV